MFVFYSMENVWVPLILVHGEYVGTFFSSLCGMAVF